MRYLIAFLLMLPLAACFDVEMTVQFIDSEKVGVTTVMTMNAEDFAEYVGDETDVCDEGITEIREDGSYVCTVTDVFAIDDLIAGQVNQGQSRQALDGVAFEQLEPGSYKVSFDLTDFFDEDDPSGDKSPFAGHWFTMNVVAAEILTTNGTLSEDRTSATYTLPLAVPEADRLNVLASFEVTVRLP